MTVFPLAVAVSVVMAGAPVKLIFRVPVAPFVNPPFPARADVTVNAALFVTVIPLIVTFGIDKVPTSVWALVLNVCTPVPAVKVPLLVMPPWKVTASFAEELFQVPPLFTVTMPVKVLVPVAEEMAKVPVVPPPITVVPVTVRLYPAAVKVVPSPTMRLPPMASAATVVTLAVPLKLKLPPIVMPFCNVLTPLPERMRLL